MLDKTISYYGIIMIKEDILNYPRYHLPEGYYFTNYSEGDQLSWSKLQVEVDQFDSIKLALDYFNKEFMSDYDKLKNNMVFVKNTKEEIIATAAIWDGNHFGYKKQRLHWVSVNPNNQGLGIGKAIITKCLDLYTELNDSNFLYLTSQTYSYKAINLYLEFGFRPYLKEKPVNWSGTKDQFIIDNNLAWKIIMNKINFNLRLK